MALFSSDCVTGRTSMVNANCLLCGMYVVFICTHIQQEYMHSVKCVLVCNYACKQSAIFYCIYPCDVAFESGLSVRRAGHCFCARLRSDLPGFLDLQGQSMKQRTSKFIDS